MPQISADLVLGQLAPVLREALEGSPGRELFTDSGAEGGFFGTLTPLTAKDASRPVAGTWIAAHVHINSGRQSNHTRSTAKRLSGARWRPLRISPTI